jgi:hypothetical protein
VPFRRGCDGLNLRVKVKTGEVNLVAMLLTAPLA